MEVVDLGEGASGLVARMQGTPGREGYAVIPLAQLIGRTYRFRTGRAVKGALVMEQHVGTLKHIAVTCQGELAWCRGAEPFLSQPSALAP